MKSSRVSVFVLAGLCVVFLVYLVLSAPLLPERVATHFGGGGRPNGWMSRSSHLLFLGAIGVGLPLLFAGIARLIKLSPTRFLNIPHREYWLSPERRSETCAYVSRQLLWLACLMVVFFTGIQYLTIQANRMSPVRLPMELFLPLVGAFVLSLGAWVIALIWRFAKTTE